MTALLQVTQVMTDSLPTSPVVNSFSLTGTLIELVAWLAPIAIGAYASKIAEWVMAVNAWLDARSGPTKQIAVGLLSFLFAKATQFLGVPITDVGTFVAAVLPYLFKLGEQAKQAREAAEGGIPVDA